MASFSLNIAFTAEQLNILYITGTNVVIAKSVNGLTPNVAWQVLRPMQSNHISWVDDYGIYASPVNITNGARLNQMSQIPSAIAGQLYTLESSTVITGPVSGGYPDTFSILNHCPSYPYLTFGMTQSASVNGVDNAHNAISATPVLLQSTAFMAPQETVYVWLQSMITSNSVVTMIASPMTMMRFGNGITDISVGYDSASGRFIPMGASLLRSGESAAEEYEFILPNL